MELGKRYPWRYGVRYPLFCEIALDCYLIAQKAYISLMEQPGEEPDTETFGLRDAVMKNCIESICFSTMALESYINNYAAVYISQSFADAIDRLDIPAKWIVSIKMSINEELKNGEAPLQKIAAVTKKRNGFVHSKSKNVQVSEQGARIPIIDLRNDYMTPAYDGLCAIAEAADLIRSKCTPEYATICEEDFVKKFNDHYKDVDVAWCFPEESIIF